MNNKHGLLVVDQELVERDVKIACKAGYPVYILSLISDISAFAFFA
jgi:hypothetical protein